VETDRSTLVRQIILAEPSVNGSNWRVVSKNPINWSAKLGWYVDLLTPPYPPGTAKRTVVSTPSSAMVGQSSPARPSSDPCASGGTS